MTPHEDSITCTHIRMCVCVQVLDSDRLVLQKMRKAAKAKYTSGQGKETLTPTQKHTLALHFTDFLRSPSDHVSHLEHYINSMEKLSVNCHSNGETEVGSAFCRLADFSRELVSPMKNLVSHRSASCHGTRVRGHSICSLVMSCSQSGTGAIYKPSIASLVYRKRAANLKVSYQTHLHILFFLICKNCQSRMRNYTELYKVGLNTVSK